jgi:endonuclease VIII-like 1
MPELAELRLTSDFINKSASGLKFVNIKKNPVHKGNDIEVPFKFFKISAESRGKELMLTISDNDSTEKLNLLMTMGMSGHFAHTNTGNEKKHSHLMFIEKDGTTLSFVDVRRFGKWKWVDDWSANRGPDPTKEYDLFTDNIIHNLHKAAFNHPIHTVLMNQSYFNGIGNYLRAEILYRLSWINPFEPAREILKREPDLFVLCRDIPLQAYKLGGGQLKDWENPFSTDPEPLRQFMRCYGNPKMSKRKDKNGRMFWYDSKWNDDALWDHYSGLPNPSAYV